jgi:putative transposase
MASPHRVQVPGGIYHITTRGNDRQMIFRDAVDYEFLLSVCGRVMPKLGWQVHAYCFMGNHFHFVVTTAEPNLAAGMQQVSSAYAVHFNRRHGRRGHLFERRYFSILIEGDRHALEVCRYTVLNPPRAGLGRADRWPWSSYHATAGHATPPHFLTVEWLLGQFASDPDRARERYREFIAEGASASSLRGLLTRR